MEYEESCMHVASYVHDVTRFKRHRLFKRIGGPVHICANHCSNDPSKDIDGSDDVYHV